MTSYDLMARDADALAILGIDLDAVRSAVEAGFGPGALERFAAMAAMIEGMDGARLPGRRRQQTASDLAEAGIPIDSAFLAEIEALGA